MKKTILYLIIINLCYAVSLQSVYDEAGPGNGYDKYVILDYNTIYTGEIGIYEGSVFIEGNGAIIDLNSGLGIWVYAEENYPATLDIEYVTIVNGGYNALTFNGTSTGNILNCNFISNDFGIQIMDETSISVKNCNFINNNQYGIARRGTASSFDISYSNFWENELGCGGYNENCWGLTWVQLELQGSGLIEYNPLFINQNNWDFTYQDNSPCIDAGDPGLTDPDGTRIDIGAHWYGESAIDEPGDCNSDGIQNILDVVYLINDCILNNNNCSCGDMNIDNQVNVLDVVILVNTILGELN